MAGRRQARIAALQLLYQVDLLPDTTSEMAESMLEELVSDPDLRKLAWQLYTGTLAERNKIDQQIQSVAVNWRVSRMSSTDRNVIRMGIYEMTVLQTPGPVVMDECIEIAKEFGTAQSGQFVNAILDKLKPAEAASP